MIHTITPKLFHYAWGSTRAIPDMLGLDATDQPVAEAWFGDVADAIAADGSKTTLGDLIARDPTSALGHRSVTDARPELPYLAKLLAAQQPLSIQVHPSAEAAANGFELENSLGIPQNDPNRVYRDCNAKPEVILALGHFELLGGFRDPLESAMLIESLSVPALKPTTELLSAGTTESLRSAVTDLCTLDVDAITVAVDQVAVACAGPILPDYAASMAWIGDLAKKFPSDVGILLALLMNHVTLERFDVAFVDAGVVHTYLGGIGFEVMGNSDNVVRAGLTVKHIDLSELLRIMKFEPCLPHIVRAGEQLGAATTFDVPTNRFDLSLVRIHDVWTEFQVLGPELIVVLEGKATVNAMVSGTDGSPPVELRLGQAAFVAADTDSYRVAGTGYLGRVTAGGAVAPKPLGF